MSADGQNVHKVMSKKLITIAEDANLDAAYAVMIKSGIRHLPVVNDKGSVVGILSDRDLQRALKSHVVGTGIGRWESCEFDPQHVVADYMSWPVKTIDMATPLKTVIEKMVEDKISSILVSKGSEVVGIVTTVDLLKLLAALLGEGHETWKETLESVLMKSNLGAAAQTLSNWGI